MADYRDPSATAITGLSLGVSVTTFLIAATFFVRKGLVAASFYSSVLGMVVPCVAVDLSLFTVDSEEKMSVWYFVRVAQMVFSSTLVVTVSIQRLKVFADAGLAEWLTDRRLLWNDKSLERQLLSTVILGGDALSDMICTVIAFVLVLRVRVAVLAMQTQWQFITELVKSHKTKGQAPVSDSCSSRGTSGPGPVTGDKLMSSLFNLSRHATQVSASTTRRGSRPEPPSPVVPLLHGGSGEKVSPSAAIPGSTGAPSTDSAVVDAVGG